MEYKKKHEKEIGSWEKQLLSRLQVVQSNCGMLCNVLNSPRSISYYGINDEQSPFRRIEIPDLARKCQAIVGMKEIDAADGTFPNTIPESLLPLFTLNHTIHHEFYFRFMRQKYLESQELVWNKTHISDWILRAEQGTLEGSYGVRQTNRAYLLIREAQIVKGKSVLVIGSETPWLEAVALANGAIHVTTLEYSNIVSGDPRVSTETPTTFRNKFINGILPTFDGVLTYSSVEHSGLGRYGDGMNPWGDMLAIARAWCVVKKGGFMFLGVPLGSDAIQYNAHRVYGYVRYPLLTANWKFVGNVSIFHHDVAKNELDQKMFQFEKI